MSYRNSERIYGKLFCFCCGPFDIFITKSSYINCLFIYVSVNTNMLYKEFKANIKKAQFLPKIEVMHSNSTIYSEIVEKHFYS